MTRFAPLEPIAVCGMAARLPGDVQTPAEFWDMLISKRNGLVDWPPSGRFDAAGFQSRLPAKNTLQAPQAYLLNHVSLSDFDTSFFPVGAKEASRMDPMQRQLLEVAYECAENAGAGGLAHDSATRKDVGVFVGVFGEDWLQENVMDSQLAGLYRGTGFLDFLQANRVSFAMGWQGPSIVVKTGCSASLVALDMACHSLRAGECSAAVVLGVNLITCPLMTLLYTAQGLLSPSGICKTFDAAADGYGRGEAVNAVFLRRISDAKRTGDPIRALVRASATGHDGRKSGQLKPDTMGQEVLIRKAYALAGIPDSQFGETAWIECHGTGTAVGDPIELRSVANIFGQQGIIVGSVKPNVGHSEGAAGLTGLIKAVLSLEHGIIPPNIFFDTPNPLIPWADARLQVPVDALPWPTGRRKRVSVNSFGVGGSNAHVILEAASTGRPKSNPRPPGQVKSHVLLFSATHQWSLQKQILRHRDYLLLRMSSAAQHHDVNSLLSDMAYTLGCRRRHFSLRTYAIVRGHQEPTDNQDGSKLKPADELLSFNEAGHSSQLQDNTPPPRVAFVFTGQGAQSARMGYELLRDNKVFADSIHYLDQCLTALPDSLSPEWTLFDELSRAASASRLHETKYSLPCCIAIQISLVNVYRAWGVLPVAVVGHSSGEVASAYAAGVLSARKAIIIAYLRGMVMSEATVQPGAMAAVGLGPEETARFLAPGAVVACENSPSSTTVSGDTDSVQETLRKVSEADPQIRCHKLKVATAFHSHHVRASALKYEELLRPFLDVESNGSSSCALYSSVTGSFHKHPSYLMQNAHHWRDSLERVVLFRQALEALVLREHSLQPENDLLLIEIGPHPALRSAISQTLAALDLPSSGPKVHYIPTLRRGERADEGLLHSIGELYVRGVLAEVSMEAIFKQEGVSCLIDLPPYAWHHGVKHFDPPRVARVYKSAQRLPHELLGARVPDATDVEPCWRCVLEPDDQPSWLGHHIVDGRTVFPAAGFIAMAGEAIRRLGSGCNVASAKGYIVRNVAIKTALVVPPGSTVELFTRLSHAEDYVDVDAEALGRERVWYEFHIMALVPDRDGDRWTSHCRGLVASNTAFASDEAAARTWAWSGNNTLDDSFVRSVDTSDWYSIADSIGLSYGISLQGLDDIVASTTRLAASATVYDDAVDDEADYALHPTVLDLALQLNLVAMCQGVREKCDLLLLPTYVGELIVGEAERPQHDEINSESKKLNLLAEVRWVDVGKSLEGTVTVADGSGIRDGVHRGPAPHRLTIANVKFMAKPMAHRRGVPEDDPTASQLRLASVFEWAPDAELIDPDIVGSALDMIRLLSFKNPRIRVLVVGCNGDVSLARAVANALENQVMSDGEVAATLTYAAASPTELSLAKQALEENGRAGLAVGTLAFTDILQGLPGNAPEAERPFDLVLVDGAIALAEMYSALIHARQVSILSSGGYLLAERCGEKAQRKLQDLGLTLVNRYDSSTSTGNIELTIARQSHESRTPRARHVIILATPALDNLARALQISLEEDSGIRSEIQYCVPEGPAPPPMSGNYGENIIIVSMLYLQQPLEESALRPESFRGFFDMLLAARTPIVWLLPPLQLGSTCLTALSPCRRPDAACLIGLARTARNENPSLNITTVELDADSTPPPKASGAISRIVGRLLLAWSGPGDGPDMDRELGITNDGTVLIPRMTWSSLEDAEAAAPTLIGSTELGRNDVSMFRNEASYLIVGGQGGLGKSLCRWMAARGARCLVLMSPSAAAAPDAATVSFVDDLKLTFGCAVVRVGGRAEHRPDVERAVAAAEQASPRGLAGIFHMPMVLRDRPMKDMTWEDWTTAVDPKVRGAWNLHNSIQGRREAMLDFFVLFSSVSGIVGQHGQANYNAANTFLDAFVLYRRGLGLPASVLDIGIVGDVGVVARDAMLADQFRKAGYVFIGQDTVMRAVGIAISPSAPHQLVVGMSRDPQVDNTTRAVLWKRDPRMAKASSGSALSSGSSKADATRRETREIASWAIEEPVGLVTEERRVRLASCLGRAVYEVLARPLEQPPLTRNINSLGLDSFAAVELTSWIQQHFHIQVSTMESNTDISFLMLADLVMDRMVEQHRQATQPNTKRSLA
ncbi:KR domain-containing protein [Colletotrichum graminicola M1.001]|uniref:KR domain-containing protein n=1 Tax=Colletotrichum graminicola (strain M1.001 / M2 / FGSC 10212) TaxID=645133 RepID=E3Q507_COLGM|nr:KR domain-containing protein [Colletotrichum graminicola M1.001]EFQ25774.1 KR domain-containing protein [Colletotrichum graminicola M1.001]